MLVVEVGLVVLLVVLAWRLQWIADDGYIYLTHVQNWVENGAGPNLNVGERVEGYTSVGWFVLLSIGDLTNALMGELMLMHAAKRGVAGFVLDGSVRDLGYISKNAMPVYAAGVTHRGPYKDGPGEINVPISLDGMVIAPGDIVIGDSDGVLAVPQAEAAEILKKTQAKQDAETRQMQAIAQGTNDRSWVDAALKKLGCAFPQD